MLTPISVASPTRPLRITFIHSPVTSAAGMVTTIVNMPQELSLRAIDHDLGHSGQGDDDDEERGQGGRDAGDRSQQVAGDLGQREAVVRTEASRITKSCTPPARQAPMMIQAKPGKYPHCEASTGPTSGPGPAIAAKWTPKSTSRRVG